MNENSILGVSFSRYAIRIVEAELWQDSPSITNLVETPLDVPLDADALQKPELIPHFATLIDNAVDNSSLNARDVRLSVYQSLALIKTFPVENSFQNQEIRQHIEWELEQSLISPRDHYNVGFELYPQNNGTSVVIVAALRKSIINYFEDIFKKSLVTLKAIDIDMTSELRALQFLSASALEGLNLLVHYDGLYFEFALIRNGNYISFFFNDTPLNTDTLSNDANIAGSLIVNAIQKFCGRLDMDQSDIKTIILSGQPLDESSFAAVEQNVDQMVTRANSFESLNRQLNLEAEEFVKNAPEKFLSAVGMIFEDTGRR